MNDLFPHRSICLRHDVLHAIILVGTPLLIGVQI